MNGYQPVVSVKEHLTGSIVIQESIVNSILNIITHSLLQRHVISNHVEITKKL